MFFHFRMSPRQPVNRQLTVQQHRPSKSSSIVILILRGHDSPLETHFKWHLEVTTATMYSKNISNPVWTRECGTLQHHSSRAGCPQWPWNLQGHLIFIVFCLKMVLSCKVRDSGNFWKRRDKKRKFQVLKVSSVRAQELMKYRSEKKVVESTAQLLGFT